MRAWLQAQFHASGQLSGLVYGIQYPSSVTSIMLVKQFGMPGSLKYVCTELRLVLHDAVQRLVLVRRAQPVEWVPHVLGKQRLCPLLARDLEA